MDARVEVEARGVDLSRTYSRRKEVLFPLEDYESEIVVRFLLGHVFDICASESHHYPIELRICMACESVGSDRRVATQVQDYVVSIFTAATYYSIPKDYRSLSIWSLLDDAIKQIQKGNAYSNADSKDLHKSRQLYIPSRAPGGLLDDVENMTGQFSLINGLQKATCLDSRDIFFTFGWAESAFIPTSGRIPLLYFKPSDNPWKPRSMNFESYTHDTTVAERRRKIFNVILRRESPAKSRAYGLIAGRIIPDLKNQKSLDSWQATDAEVTSLVCEIMNLNVNVCLANNVGLVFATRPVNPQVASMFEFSEYTQVGLINWRKYRASLASGHGSITIAARRIEDKSNVS